MTANVHIKTLSDFQNLFTFAMLLTQRTIICQVWYEFIMFEIYLLILSQSTKKVIYLLSVFIFEIIGRVKKNPTKYLRGITKEAIFYKILINRTSNFISNLNYQYFEDSFEVLHGSVAQKLTNPEFFLMIFLSLPLVT